MSTKLILDAAITETRLAVIENDEVCELDVERPFPERLVGSIFIGKVESLLPGIQAAFVDIGYEKNAFLYAGDAVPKRREDGTDRSVPERIEPIENVLKVGQEILVQVIKEPIGTKGPRVSTTVNLPGRYAVLSLNSNHIGVSRRIESDSERTHLIELARDYLPAECGAIIRTAMHGADDDELRKDFDFLLSLKKKIDSKMGKGEVPRLLHKDLSLPERTIRDRLNDDVEKIVINDLNTFNEIYELMKDALPMHLGKLHYYNKEFDLFDFYGVSTVLEHMRERKVWLSCGGYLVIDKTEALTVIDVNTGKYTGASEIEETVFKTNMQAAEEIAKQLRLRDIGGIIIVDFIDMHDENNKRQVVDTLRECLKKDKTRSDVVGMTQLGLIEITRKKVRKEMGTLLADECRYCGGRGKIRSAYMIARRVEKEIAQFANFQPEGKIVVTINPTIAELFNSNNRAMATQFEEKYGREILFEANPLLGYEEVHMDCLN